MSLPNKICMLPWVSIEASPVGTARPCCLTKEEITDDTGAVFSLKQHTLEEIYHSVYMKNLRQEFLDGKKPETCARCWDEEASGRVSKRMNSRTRLKEYYDLVDWQNTDPNQLWFIDLKLGNICNLKCRICGSWSSSKWAKEEIDYVPNADRKDHLAYTFLKEGAWPRESPKFWENIKTLLPNIKYLEFTGGEPFLIEQHFEFLRHAVETGDSKHIDIHYNTNGTVYPSGAEEIWEQFNNVEIAVSIDNTTDRFEYERYGANWSEVVTNINKFRTLQTKMLTKTNRRIITMQLCITVNVQNVYYLPEICDWVNTQQFDHIHFNMLHDPWYMNISKMTPIAQRLVIDRLTSETFRPSHKIEILRIVKFIENGVGDDGKEFIRHMKQTDMYRGQKFSDTHFEIAKAMGYE